MGGQGRGGENHHRKHAQDPLSAPIWEQLWEASISDFLCLPGSLYPLNGTEIHLSTKWT